MTEPQVRLYVAPAAAGKTAHVLDLARDAARDLASIPRIVVPSGLQRRALRRRLAAGGGAIGVRLLTFDGIYADCLDAAGEAYTQLSEPVQFRLIRALLDELPLVHYATLVGRPGFVPVLRGLAGELKAARIDPADFSAAVEAMGGEPRLRELADVYHAYQARLQAQGWADRAGLGWLALEALEERAPGVARDWPLLLVDGFDSFTPVQLAFLKLLSRRVTRTVVTLTGAAEGGSRDLAHKRFDRTRLALQAALGVEAQPLPPRHDHGQRVAPLLSYLEANLFRTNAAGPAPAGGERALDLVQAPDRAAEVRAALRWLKACLVEDGLEAGDVALLARSTQTYRPFILQTAAEFGLPVRLLGGLPLRANPAISALLDLLRLVQPGGPGGALGEPALPRRGVVEAWRSPYFDWSALPVEGGTEPVGIGPGDADRLDAAAREGRVIGGLSQWREALEIRVRRADGEAQALQAKFYRFLQRLAPPEGRKPYRAYVHWLETLIGPDPETGARRFPVPEEPTSLRVVERALAGETTRERDIAALRALKDVLRGLVWAEEALDRQGEVDFARFYDELAGAVEAVTYQLPAHARREEIVVADVLQARGVGFRAVAVLGLAEGEFPATVIEDPFLREADRTRLRESYGLPLESSVDSAEAEYFYETATRASDRLLLTRPRLADNGALWQASPFWEAVLRLAPVEPRTLKGEGLPGPHRAASWPELLESLPPPAAGARRAEPTALEDWAARERPHVRAALDAAVDVIQARGPAVRSRFDGDLAAEAGTFAARFGPGHTWSASRLESYRACPFLFFVANVLRLEVRDEPAEGLAAWQLGNIYHHILEEVYQAPGVDDPSDLDQVLAALPAVAEAVLDAAPEREGFRETAWWVHTREEISANVARSLEALATLPGGFAPRYYEAAFGLREQPVLVVAGDGDSFQLRGFIDRVDSGPGRTLRVIDYKTAGPSDYTRPAVARGEKLQLPLYALAARDALGLGDPVEGFYWHVQHAEPSSFTLNKFEGGAGAAMDTTTGWAWAAVHGARDGYFVPKPPSRGCPDYCPAAGFCWHFRPVRRG